MIITLFFFFLGFILLLAGAEFLVQGASKLAAGFGIPPLVIGLTVVAYGTGSPELVVGIISSLYGQTDIALGNVLGSNIVNILGILGISAAICPMVIHQQLIRLDVPIMIAVTLLMWLAASSGVIGAKMGAFFLILTVLYTFFLFYKSKGENRSKDFEEEYRINGKLSLKRILIDIALIALGITLLVIGSDWLVKGAVFIANAAGVSELVISLTVIAFGTSLPELATSLVAAIKGKQEIAVGNLIGSNIFNILAVIGTAAVVAQGGIVIPKSVLAFDIPIMTFVAIACLPIFFTGHKIDRWEGFLFLGYYIVYTTYVVLRATGSPWLDPLFDSVLYFALPLTLITLGIGTYRHIRKPG